MKYEKFVYKWGHRDRRLMADLIRRDISQNHKPALILIEELGDGTMTYENYLTIADKILDKNGNKEE